MLNPISTKGGRFCPPSQRSQLTFSRDYILLASPVQTLIYILCSEAHVVNLLTSSHPQMSASVLFAWIIEPINLYKCCKHEQRISLNLIFGEFFEISLYCDFSLGLLVHGVQSGATNVKQTLPIVLPKWHFLPYWHTYFYILYICTRCLVGSTDQAYLSSFYFRIAWKSTECLSFLWNCSLSFLRGLRRTNIKYTQYPIIRNGLIRNSADFLWKFKKRALGRTNLRNASKNLRNGQCSDFQS